MHADGGSYVLTNPTSEHVVLSEQANDDIEVIIRPGDAYGPGSRPWIIAPLEAIAKNQFMLPAKGEGFFRPIYIDDLVEVSQWHQSIQILMVKFLIYLARVICLPKTISPLITNGLVKKPHASFDQPSFKNLSLSIKISRSYG